MTQNSETMMESVRKAAPTDTAAAVGAAACSLLAASRPELFEGMAPSDVAALATGIGSFGAMVRAWWRSRRRRRRLRREARARER